MARFDVAASRGAVEGFWMSPETTPGHELYTSEATISTPTPDTPIGSSDGTDRPRLSLVRPETARTVADPQLSDREIEVLLAWFRSASKIEAGRRLFISGATVNTHVSRIRAKYAAVGRPATSKVGLFARAIQDGFVRVDEW